MKKEIASISKHQGEIEWCLASKSSLSTVFSRMSEGGTYKDPNFEKNFANSKKHQLQAGAWHIFRATTSTPHEQLNNIIEQLAKVAFDKHDGLAIVVNKTVNHSATPQQMADNLHSLLQLIEDSSINVSPKDIYIKTNIDTWKNHVDWNRHAEDFIKYNLWIEHWSVNPKPGTLEPWGEKHNWTYWEFTAKGIIPGIIGEVLLSRDC